MKALILLFGFMVSTNVFAGNLAYDCEVRDFTKPGAISDITLKLDSSSGKVVDSVILGTGKNRVQVELYFQNIQIHVFDDSDSHLFSTTAPETTAIIKTSLKDVARIICKQKLNL